MCFAWAAVLQTAGVEMMDNSIGDMDTMDHAGSPSGAYTLTSGTALGQYKIIRPLGRGGMGEVYEVENLLSRKKYALKVLPAAATDGNFVDRFRVESRVMSDLRHDHIVQVHHAGEERGHYYLTMDLILAHDGEPHSLEDVLTQRCGGEERGLPEPEVLAAAEQICAAVKYAHAKGVIHRDLKPANIMVAEDGTLRVTDFGLAKAIGAEYLKSVIHRTISLSMAAGLSMGGLHPQGADGPPGRRSSSARALLGTYDYMSPEQKTGGEITARADIYAFGVILYRLLTGEKPEGAYKAPSRFGVRKGWDSIVEKCLQRNPADRYASVTDLNRDILQLTRPARPRRWVVALTTAVLTAGAVGAWLFFVPSITPPPSLDPTPSTPAPGPVASAPLSPSVSEPTPPISQTVAVRFVVQPHGVKLRISSGEGPGIEGDTDAQGVFDAQLSPGLYEINASKDGFQQLNQRLEIVGAATHRLELTSLRGELTPLRGKLTLQTTPGATVLARRGSEVIPLGKADAKGDLSYNRLEVGTYMLVFSHRDYLDGTATVEIQNDRATTAKQMLRGKPGSVYISASPKAEVWVDGTLKGHTGEWLREIEPGKRTFEVKHKGYRTKQFDLGILPSQRAAEQKLGELARAYGSIRIEATVPPYAKNYYDIKEKKLQIGAKSSIIRSLPYKEEELDCEKHQVFLEVAGFAVDNSPRSVAVEDGKTTTERFELMPKPAKLTINTDAKNAEVFDSTGARLGQAGEALSVRSLQSVVLTVRASDYTEKNIEIDAMDPEVEATKSVTLEKLIVPKVGGDAAIADLELKLIWVVAGRFEMGSNDGQNDEKPIRNVTITRGYWMGRTEVTQKLYEAIMGKNPSHFKGEKLPVEMVSWDDATRFCERLTEKEHKADRLPKGYVYRLPTEAEWEYAARGGGKARKYNYAGSNSSRDVAWASDNSGEKTHPVGTLKSNELGLFDMSGNVWEWCHDWHQENYKELATTDPTGPASGSYRVFRGGSWDCSVVLCRVASRSCFFPTRKESNLGFRVVLGPAL